MVSGYGSLVERTFPGFFPFWLLSFFSFKTFPSISVVVLWDLKECTDSGLHLPALIEHLLCEGYSMRYSGVALSIDIGQREAEV